MNRILLIALFALLFSCTSPSVGKDRTPRVLNGIDILREQNFAPISGKRVGLITNHSGLSADGTTSIELLHRSNVCTLVALFSPEHGISGRMDSKVGSSLYEGISVPVYSLYGESVRPTPEMLRGIDVLLFDIQDIGARFYTYITTMGYCMEEAARAGIPFYVLDRPNPIGGVQVEGPMLDPDKTSFVGYLPMPVRHGMTVGELARYFRTEKKIGVELHVIEMQGWARPYYFWDTGQLWVDPSPNMRSMAAAILYPGVCLLEQANVSVGRGTDRPFEMLGAPWIEPRRLAAELASFEIPGVSAVPLFFTPDAGKHRGTRCGGVSFTITDVERFNSVLLGFSLISVLCKLYPKEFEARKTIELLGNEEALKRLESGESPAGVLRAGNALLRQFLAKREKALIYDMSPRRKKERR